jgi:predicted O-methyltransferase YrrM
MDPGIRPRISERKSFENDEGLSQLRRPEDSTLQSEIEMTAAVRSHPIEDVFTRTIYVIRRTSRDPFHVLRFAKLPDSVNGLPRTYNQRSVWAGNSEEKLMQTNVIQDPAVIEVLSEYRRRMEAEDALRSRLSRQEWLQRRDEFLLEVGEAVASLMHILVCEARAKTILEVGTSYGYSTVWFADAARATGGKVITLDVNAQKQAYARSMLERAGLLDFVIFRCGDALELIDQMKETVDFALIDLWKDLYIPCFDRVIRKASPGALIIADNMIFPPDNQAMAAAYRAHVRSLPDFDSVLLPAGHGIEVSRRR